MATIFHGQEFFFCKNIKLHRACLAKMKIQFWLILTITSQWFNIIICKKNWEYLFIFFMMLQLHYFKIKFTKVCCCWVIFQISDHQISVWRCRENIFTISKIWIFIDSQTAALSKNKWFNVVFVLKQMKRIIEDWKASWFSNLKYI